MGEKPGGTSLGRIDNDKGYSPENCRWETVIQQARNRTNNRILELNGESRTVTEWANHLGVPSQRLYNRLHYGWPIERVLTSLNYANVNNEAPKSSVSVSPVATVKVAP